MPAKTKKQNKKPTPLDSDFQPNTENEAKFQLFRLWRSLPPMMLGKDKAKLRELGYDDEVLLELMQIRTHKDFAAYIDVHVDTITDWKKKMAEAGEPYGDWKLWGRRLTRTVQNSLFLGIVKDKDAPRVKLWNQLAEGFEEKTKNTVVIEKLDGILDAVEKSNGKK